MAFFLKMNIVLFLGPGLLRTILVVVLIYYGSKFLFKWWLKRKMDAARREERRTMSEDEANFRRNEKGKVHIKQNKSSSSTGSSGGEYIDYEEVDE